MTNRLWSPRLQKWLSLSALFILTLLPCVLISSLFAISIAHALYFQVTLMGVNALLLCQQHFLSKKASSSDKHLLNANDPHESNIIEIFEDVKSRAKLSNITLFANDSLDDCSATGWPFANTILLSENLIGFCKKDFPKKTLAAIFAHELTHLKNADTFSRLVTLFCVSTIELEFYIFIASGIIIGALTSAYLLSLLIGSAPLLFLKDILVLALPLTCTVLGMGCFKKLMVFFQQKLSHALEFMADEGAVILTHDPVSVALMPFEINFHRLSLQPDIPYFKDIQIMAKKHGIQTGELYRQTLKNANKSLDNSDPAQHSHPPDAMRRKVIKAANSQAFKGIPKLLY